MKKIYLLLFTICFALMMQAQSTANYTFATNTSGSFTDMSSGTTQLIAADQDDFASPVTNIGFDFFLNGSRYAQFSVNSNGTLRFGTTAVVTTGYDPLGQPGQALVTAYGADQRTHAGDGKVHYKVTGAAPNRVLAVEWRNTQADFNVGGTANLTYQLRLYETTGVIENVYGAMTMSAAGAVDANSVSPQFGFTTGNTAGTVGTVTAVQSGTPAPTYNGAAATVVNNTYTAGVITVLSSSTDGSRRMFSYTPSFAPATPTGLSFSGVSTTSITLNWTDNASNESGYAIYRSTDGISYSFNSQVAANSTSSVQNDLLAGTNYYWKIYALAEGALSSALSGTQATPEPTIIISSGSGLWSSPATWAGAVVPTVNDAVTIRDGDVVTIDAAATAYSITVGQGVSGIVEFEATTARTLSVYSNVNITAGGIFQSATSGTQTGHVLSIGGDLTNNGTLAFSTNTDAAGANLLFTGITNNTFGGSGAVTDIRGMTINKGTSNTAVLELNPTNFTVRGSNTDVVVGGFLVLTNGTLKISGNFTYTGRMFGAAAYTIAAATGVWLNNPNFTIAAQNGNAVNNGRIRLTDGTWNIGTLATATFTGGAGALYTIEGGTLNVAGRMNPSAAVSYNQSGGVVNLATAGNSGSGTGNATFGLTSGTASFNMSGGTINLVQASTGATPVDWIVGTASFVVTGGIVNAGTAATATNFNFRVRAYVPNLAVDNSTNNKTVTIAAQTNSIGTVTVNPGATLVYNGQVWLIIGPGVVNNGTITGTAAGSRFYFQGTGPQTYSGSGTTNAVALELDNNTFKLTIDPLSNGINAQQRVNFFSGGITNANKVILGLGGITNATVQMGVAGATKPVSGFDVAPTFNIGSAGQILVYAPELTARTTGMEVIPGRNISFLSMLNPNGIVIDGGDLTISAGATPTLTMTTGNITTGSNTLTLGASDILPGTYTYTAGTIVGKFKRWIGAATGNRDFPVGIAAAKRNASINFTAAPATGGTLTAQWVAAQPGVNGLPLTEGPLNVTSTSNEGYWSMVAGDGLTGGTYTGTFSATGIADITDVTKLVLVKRANAASPWVLDGVHVTGSGTPTAAVLSRTDMSGFSEFGIGSDEFVILAVDLLSFSGQKTGKTNLLRWTTASEQNNRGFEVQRSTDGLNYSTLTFVNSHAAGGNSSSELSYSFVDGQPAGMMQYYRLRQVNIDNQSKFSSVVLLKSEKPTMLAIDGLFPNPTLSIATVRIAAVAKERLTIVITDISGKPVARQIANVDAGNNSIAVDVSSLPGGTYIIKLVCSTGHCESAVARFVKQ